MGATSDESARGAIGLALSLPLWLKGCAMADSKSRKPSPAAERALAEAAARRAEVDRKTAERPKEKQGRNGLEPTRYGDWEKKGIASDF
jgi:hypothetical protein